MLQAFAGGIPQLPINHPPDGNFPRGTIGAYLPREVGSKVLGLLHRSHEHPESHCSQTDVSGEQVDL